MKVGFSGFFYNSMILVYSDNITERLRYICSFILTEQLGLDYRLTDNLSDCDDRELCIINYSDKISEGNCFNIKPAGLLFEQGIKKQHINCFDNNGTTCFFRTLGGDFHFDIFAAGFYLLSRYEEYLPHEKDFYGRFSHSESLAFQQGFLSQPLVNIWIREFAEALQSKFPSINFTFRSYQAIVTYDIDIAWSYKHKGLLRNLGGFMKSPSLERLKVLMGLQKDPFDCYDELISLHQNSKSKVIIFFPMAEKVFLYDRNISPSKKPIQNLIKQLSSSFEIGLHPSWKSFTEQTLIQKEKNILQSIIEKDLVHSRQHYIKFELPSTYRNLSDAGIKYDHSMGYGSINGFRASVASDFLWYDLAKEQITGLRLFPFCFMDANSFYEQHQDAETSLKELMYYKKICEENNGLFISIFHNHIIGTDKKFKGWSNMHNTFISQVQ